jgi:tetratricopeptide (TPR) repeat protein
VTRGAAPAVAALAAALAGCAASPPLAAGLPASAPRAIELDSTPFFPQQEYQCGPAALATLLAASGVAVEPDALTPQVYLPERQGSLSLELVGAARRHGRLPYVLDTTAEEMVEELKAGRPVLVLQNLGLAQLPRWHYAVLVGYDVERNVAVLRSGSERRLEMKWQRFAGSWHRGGRFAMTTLRPAEIPAHAPPGRFIAAAAGLEAAGQRRAAAAAYDAAIARWPREPHAWLGRGNVAYADGDRAAAADAWSRAIALDPADAAARNNLAELLLDAGCLDESRRQIERAAALAAGTSLEAEVAQSKSRIGAALRPGGNCQLEGRAWPD